MCLCIFVLLLCLYINYERNIEMVLQKIYKESDSSQILFATVFELAYWIDVVSSIYCNVARLFFMFRHKKILVYQITTEFTILALFIKFRLIMHFNNCTIIQFNNCTIIQNRCIWKQTNNTGQLNLFPSKILIFIVFCSWNSFWLYLEAKAVNILAIRWSAGTVTVALSALKKN